MITLSDETKNEIINMLSILKRVYEDEVIPTMIDDGNHNERIEDIEILLQELGKEIECIYNHEHDGINCEWHD